MSRNFLETKAHKLSAAEFLLLKDCGHNLVTTFHHTRQGDMVTENQVVARTPTTQGQLKICSLPMPVRGAYMPATICLKEFHGRLHFAPKVLQWWAGLAK